MRSDGIDAFAPFKITICGLDELSGHCGAGATHVLSILDPDWPVPDDFETFSKHARLEIRFHDVIDQMADYIAPRPQDVADLLAFGREVAAEPPAGVHMLVHCHAGISRSTAAVTLLLAQALPDRSGHEILAEVLHIRPVAWPNLAIIEMGDAMLGRGGELVEATIEVYRHHLALRPDLAGTLEQEGRGREIAAARGWDKSSAR